MIKEGEKKGKGQREDKETIRRKERRKRMG